MRLAYLKDFWDKYNLKTGIEINPLLNPSLLITGESGSGKSYGLKYNIYTLIDSEIQRGRKVDLWFLNYKDSRDFRFLKPYERYYCCEACKEGVEAFYNHYQEIRKNEGEGIDHMTIMVFDEYPAYILQLQMEEKKRAEAHMRKISEILMTSRSYHTGCWIACQRSDSAYFANGSREQFHIRILLTRGLPSKESLSMMGFVRENFKSEIYHAGEGIAFVDGQGLYEIKYPVYDTEKINKRILEGLACAQ